MARSRKLELGEANWVRQIEARRRKLLDELRTLPSRVTIARQLDVSETCIRRIDEGATYKSAE